MLYSINRPDLIARLLLLRLILGNVAIAIVRYSGCGVINFEIKLKSLIEPHFLHGQNVKSKVILRMKRVLNIKQKIFLIIFKGYPLKPIMQFFV